MSDLAIFRSYVSESSQSSQSRLLWEIKLEPVQGHRFQPTNFPSLGAAVYEAGGQSHVIVESHQSMANRLEQVLMNEAGISKLDVSYVSLYGEGGQVVTTSLKEPHRLNSVHLLNAKDHDGRFTSFEDYVIAGLTGNGWIEWLFEHDVNSLIHGVFFSQVTGCSHRRVSRLVSAFIEAHGASVALSGGVKTEPVKDTKADAAQGGGMIPFSREEFVAEKIVLYVNVDLAQLRAYQLGEDRAYCVLLLVLYKLRLFLSGSMRLRTMCDLEVKGGDAGLPNIDVLEKELKEVLKSVGMSQLKLVPGGVRQAKAKANQEKEAKKKATKATKATAAADTTAATATSDATGSDETDENRLL